MLSNSLSWPTSTLTFVEPISLLLRECDELVMIEDFNVSENLESSMSSSDRFYFKLLSACEIDKFFGLNSDDLLLFLLDSPFDLFVEFLSAL